MQLIGQAIQHKKFGKGIITEWHDTIIGVQFDIGLKKFVYPDAFSEFLILEDSSLQREIVKILAIRIAAEKAGRKGILEEQKRIYMLRNFEIHPQSQAVFDIRPNHVERVLSTWTVSTGCYLGGNLKGEPRIPNRLHPNSMCLLTVRDNKAEAERYIIGAFMVEADFLGTYCKDGIIKAHPDYRLRFPHEQRLNFWPYVNTELEKQRWGKKAFHYIRNRTVEHILFDVKEHFLPESLKKNADLFYQYFCKMNYLQGRSEVENKRTENSGS